MRPLLTHDKQTLRKPTHQMLTHRKLIRQMQMRRMAIERQEFDARFEWTEAVLAAAGSLAAEFSRAEMSSVDIDRALRKARLSLISAIDRGKCLESPSADSAAS